MRVRWIKDFDYDQRDAKGNLLRSYSATASDQIDTVLREVGEAGVAAGAAEAVDPNSEQTEETKAEEPKGRGRR